MPQADPAAGARRRILVVEDEYLVADYLAVVLEDLGYEVVGPVPTIPEAMNAIAGEKLDVVLLDANLGGKSSAPIATELAARGVPFIVVTGYGSLDLASAALQTAPRINKPFTSATLAAMLVKIVAS
jgi:DNA-binding response OmpR family regulator